MALLTMHIVTAVLVWVVCDVVKAETVCEGFAFAPTINMDTYKEVTDRHFISVALGTRTLLRTVGGNAQFDLESQRFYTLAKSLSPLTARVGGSYANFFIFHPSEEQYPKSYDGIVPQYVIDEWKYNMNASDFWHGSAGSTDWSNAVFSGWWLKRLAGYLEKVNWDLVIDINQLLQYQGQWDSFNFRLLLDFILKHNIKVEAFQLGNEAILQPSKLPRVTISSESTAQDYRAMRAVLDEYSHYADTPVYGPEVTSLARSHGAREWFMKFLKAGGGQPLGAFGFHHYYFDGRQASDASYFDTSKMTQFQELPILVKELKEEYGLQDVPAFMTETADAYNGGSAEHSPTFIATFIYLDNLGLCARGGIKRVHRQTFNSGDYALINRPALTPNPDYYLSVTHKRLILGPVLDISIYPEDSNLRIYAHCARMDYYNYSRGAAVIYYANLFETVTWLDLSNTFSHTPDMDLYIFTSGDPNTLKTEHIRLNGILLNMTKNSKIPTIEGAKQQRDDLELPGHSFGFIVVKNAEAPACLNRPDDEPEVDGSNALNMMTGGVSGYAHVVGKYTSSRGGISHNQWIRITNTF